MTRRRRITVLALGVAGAMSIAMFGGAGAAFAQAQAKTDRGKLIGGKFMCMCGCNQVLTQCNHVGCPVSSGMLKELDDSVTRGDSEDLITQNFVQEFGTKVYAEPPKSGLSLVAWVLPSVYLVLGTVLVIFVISRWRTRACADLGAMSAGSGAAAIPSAELERARQRVARETED